MWRLCSFSSQRGHSFWNGGVNFLFLFFCRMRYYSAPWANGSSDEEQVEYFRDSKQFFFNKWKNKSLGCYRQSASRLWVLPAKSASRSLWSVRRSSSAASHNMRWRKWGWSLIRVCSKIPADPVHFTGAGLCFLLVLLDCKGIIFPKIERLL